MHSETVKFLEKKNSSYHHSNLYTNCCLDNRFEILVIIFVANMQIVICKCMSWTLDSAIINESYMLILVLDLECTCCLIGHYWKCCAFWCCITFDFWFRSPCKHSFMFVHKCTRMFKIIKYCTMINLLPSKLQLA